MNGWQKFEGRQGCLTGRSWVLLTRQGRAGVAQLWTLNAASQFTRMSRLPTVQYGCPPIWNGLAEVCRFEEDYDVGVARFAMKTLEGA